MGSYAPWYGYQVGPMAPIAKINSQTYIVVNADIAQSLTDALDYCSRRGIPTANIRSFHFGTFNYPVLWNGISTTNQQAYLVSNAAGGGTITPAANYNGLGTSASLLSILAYDIQTNGALCILCSTYTPSNYVGNPTLTITGQIVSTGTTLTVTAITGPFGISTGGSFGPVLSGGTITGNPIIQSQPTGLPGGTGTYGLSVSQTANSSGPLNVIVGSGIQSSTGLSFAAICGNAAVLSVFNYISNTSQLNYASGFASDGINPPATTYPLLLANNIPSTWSSFLSAGLRPHGRLGCPDLTTMKTTFAMAELPLASGGTTVYNNAVTNALANEKVNNYLKPVHYSSVDSPTAGLGPTYQAYVNAQFPGASNAVDMGSQAVPSSIGGKFISSNPMQPYQTFWSVMLLGGFNTDALGINQSSYFYNNAGISSGQLAFQNNYNLLPGAWAQCWYSYGYNFGMNMLYNGASAALFPVAEPLSLNVTYAHEVYHYALNQGVPLCLANVYCANQVGNIAFGTTVYGDPLYAPYSNTTPPGYGVGRGVVTGSNVGVS